MMPLQYLLFLAVFFGLSISVWSEVPRVEFPNQKEGAAKSEPEGKTSGPRFRMKARKSGDDVDVERKRPDFAPGAIQPGALDENTQIESLPAELQAVAKAGALAMAAQEFEKAKSAFEQMVAAVPDNELARANLGTVEYKLRNYAEARKHLELAVAKNPKIAKNWETLGLVHFRSGDLELAISRLMRAISIDPKNARSHQYLAVVLGAYGWMDAAEKELQVAVQLDPADPDSHFNLAVLYMDRKEPAHELAWRHYQTGVELGGKPDPVLENRIKVARLNASKSTN